MSQVCSNRSSTCFLETVAIPMFTPTRYSSTPNIERNLRRCRYRHFQLSSEYYFRSCSFTAELTQAVIVLNQIMKFPCRCGSVCCRNCKITATNNIPESLIETKLSYVKLMEIKPSQGLLPGIQSMITVFTKRSDGFRICVVLEVAHSIDEKRSK